MARKPDQNPLNRRARLTLYPLSSLGLCEAVIMTPAAAPSFLTAYG